MPQTTSPTVDIIVKVIGAALAAGAAAATTYFLSHRRTSDRNKLKFIRRVFDRPAFRGPFLWQTDPQPYYRAVGLTIKALKTGVLQDRQGRELERGSPVSDIRRAVWRNTLADAASRLKAISNHIDEYIQAVRGPGGVPPAIDSERDEVIRLVNSVLTSAKLEPLPIPSTWTDNSTAYELE